MFKEIAFLQWKTSRFAVYLLLPLCVALPLLLLRIANAMIDAELPDAALGMLHVVNAGAVAFPILAAAAGTTVALTAWAWDHRTHHVYALSLPIERWRYALIKMGAGTLMLVVLAAAVLLGALLALGMTPLPDGIRGYPLAFATRFLFAALICYAVTFAFAAGTIRTTVRVFTALFIVFIVGSVVTEIAGRALGTPLPTPAELLGDALVSWPGPFHVFGGSWMLIDV